MLSAVSHEESTSKSIKYNVSWEIVGVSLGLAIVWGKDCRIRTRDSGLGTQDSGLGTRDSGLGSVSMASDGLIVDEALFPPRKKARLRPIAAHGKDPRPMTSSASKWKASKKARPRPDMFRDIFVYYR